MLVVYRHFLGESHPAAGEGPEGVLGGRGGRVDGARSESGAAREQAVIGEVVEGFSQCRRGVHDDLFSVFIAVVRAFTAVSRAIFSWRIISTAPSAVFGMAVDCPASTDRAATSASRVSDLPAARRVRRSPRFTSTTRCPARRTARARPAP